MGAGQTDPRRDTNVDFVGGIRGAAELERRVREQGWSVGLFLYPTRIEQLMSVSNAGQLMPPKSTWFEPKLRSGPNATEPAIGRENREYFANPKRDRNGGVLREVCRHFLRNFESHRRTSRLLSQDDV
jgi:hypothetical protein